MNLTRTKSKKEMEKNGGHKYSGNNISGRRPPLAPRRLPLAPTHGASTSARPSVPINGPIPTSRPVLNGHVTPTSSINCTIPVVRTTSTARTTFTSHTAPTARTMPVGQTKPIAHTIPTGYTTPTSIAPHTCSAVSTGSTVPVGCVASTIHTLSTNRNISIACTTSTAHVRPTNQLASTVGAAPTNSITPTCRGAHTNPVVRGPDVSIGYSIPFRHTAPARRTMTTNCSVPSGRVVGARPVVSNGYNVPVNHTLSTGRTYLTNRTVNSERIVRDLPTGPTYPPLLKLQASHRSQCVIEGEYLEPLFARGHITPLPWDPRYEEYVIAAGLYGVHKIGHITSDHALISALVERWRQETHTFHFPVGEMTITLQDVSVLLGLRVDGEEICFPTNCDWSAVVESLFGRVDKKTFRKKSKVAINISWLVKHFSKCPVDADNITLRQFARAYCFVLVGSVLFTDHSGDSISAIYLPLFEDFRKAGRLSWASGVLAYLYKELCLATMPTRMQFGGSVMLLQLWSWERLPMGRPTTRKNVERPQLGGEDLTRRPPLGYGWSFDRKYADHVTCRVMESYRREIDALIDSKVCWLPYEDKMHLLPANCRAEDRLLWRTTAPLIHFWIVEMHNPGRVGRQFGSYQNIPPPLRDTNEDLHKLTNGAGEIWPLVHFKHRKKWNIRQHLYMRDQRPYDHSRHEQYMRWFSRASILYLSSPGGVPNTNSSAQRVTHMATTIVERFRYAADENSRAFARDLLHHCRSAIKALLEPISNDNIFTALDGERPQWRQVSPVPDGDPRPSNRPPTKRARRFTSTSL